MDVLELPRPVINFLRTMSKEMNRYSLCWDIYGGSESVTLTLTWKINDLLIENNIQQQQNPQHNNLIENLTMQQQKQVPQQINKNHDHSGDSASQQQQKLKNQKDLLFNDLRKSRKQSIETDIKKDSINPRGKSLENLNKKNNSPPAADTASASYTITNDPTVGHTDSLVRQCPPPSLAYMKRKNLYQKSVLSKQLTTPPPQKEAVYHIIQSADPWIKRNNCPNETTNDGNHDGSTKILTAVMTKLDSNSVESCVNERKLSLQSTDSYNLPNQLLNAAKVSFDPNLHYI
jgi:hypothetical protein